MISVLCFAYTLTDLEELKQTLYCRPEEKEETRKTQQDVLEASMGMFYSMILCPQEIEAAAGYSREANALVQEGLFHRTSVAEGSSEAIP